MKTHVHVAIDDDDPMFIRYEDVMEHHGGDGDRLESGPRDGLVGWTNKVAMDRIDDYGYFGSFGDDHIPRTPGWDKALIEGIERMGGTGITYPWDGTREDIPEAPVVSADIIRELGWFLHPDLHHWYGDNVLADLGRGAGCIRHLRAIAVDHVWEADQTSKDSGEKLAADREAYFLWRKERMKEDIAIIAALRSRVLQPV
jgi:hypothetical protein